MIGNSFDSTAQLVVAVLVVDILDFAVVVDTAGVGDGTVVVDIAGAGVGTAGIVAVGNMLPSCMDYSNMLH